MTLNDFKVLEGGQTGINSLPVKFKLTKQLKLPVK